MENLFELSVDGKNYKIFLPNSKTDYIQRKIVEEGVPYELEMLRAISKQLTKDSLVLDVGANVGNHCLYIASVVGCKVEAFEPNESLCQALMRSLEVNALTHKVKIHQVGVSSCAGYAHFSHIDESNLGSQSLESSNKSSDEIELVSLDDRSWDEPVSMIKIDVEGMELDVLKGAISLLERDKPLLYVEARDAVEFEDLYGFISKIGYICYETYNATPTHCFIHEEKIEKPRELALPLLRKAEAIYRNKKAEKSLRGKLDEARNALSDAKKSYRVVCEKNSDLKNQLHAVSENNLVLNEQLSEALQKSNGLQEKLDFATAQCNEVSIKYRAANAKYRHASQQISALRASKPYKAGLYIKAASGSWKDAIKLPVRLWRLKGPQKNKYGWRVNLVQKLRYLKWNVVIPLATRLGIPYSKVAYLTLPRSLKGIMQGSPSSARSPESTSHEAGKFIPPSSAVQEISILGWPEHSPNGKPYVIGIMDEFTAGCFEKDVNLIQPRPDNWYALAEKYKPALFFIESAWKGNHGSWQYRVADYSNKPGHEVAHICQYAREKEIPTIFWNKEDPVHHRKFMCSAKLVDYIFTTDANMKASYQAKTGNTNVHALPFAAQPALHKPAPLAGREARSCFAGSWYGNRHAERGEAMSWLLQAANRYGLDIYDRNHGSGIFPFPNEYQAGIKGSLPYKELCGEYRRYRVFLNVNSVTDSPTMFSRRVFELMACGTPVVSTYAKGIENLFDSQAVWLVNSPEEADEAIHTLMTNDAEWRRRSLAGIREVFARHTYAHRLNDIFGHIGIGVRMSTDPAIALVAVANGKNELESLERFARQQRYSAFRLGIVCLPEVASLSHSHSDRVELLEPGQVATWIANRQAEYPIAGWISHRFQYGEHYLRDLANATLYEPEASGWAKALVQDCFAYGGQAVVGGTLWKSDVFLGQFINTQSDEIFTRSDLYLADSDQFQPGDIGRQRAFGG